jgi:hypothetical protein
MILLFSRSVALFVVLYSCLASHVVLGQGALYPKIEASFTISGISTDPVVLFDYTQTDVKVAILQPDSTTVTLPAFYDGGTTWRVRHSPAMPGIYQITGVTLNGSTISVGSLQPSSWVVSGFPTSPGFVSVDPANTNKFITSNGRRHFPLGNDVAWWTNNTQLGGIIAKLGGAHENWSRIWMMHFYDSLNLEWPKVGALGNFSLSVAQKWDAIVSAAEQNGVAFQMTLQHHGQYSTTVDPNWTDNPYNTANGGFLSNATNFFTDATAKALTKKKYRYIVARWGCSPAIMAWELFNEVQFSDAAQNGQWSNVAAWHDEMAQFIRSQDHYQHLVTTSSQIDQPIWNQCDYYQHHDYPNDYLASLRDEPGITAGYPIKPIFSGECGYYNSVSFYGFHPPLWASLMAAQSGAAQQWYGDAIEAQNAYSQYRSARDFVLRSGFADQDTLIKSAPRVICSQNTSLSFAPGGGWATASQDVFTVADTAPAGITTLPSYLQGVYHKSMTPNGYTFLVNYPVNGTFSVYINQIAQSGATMRILRDGSTATNLAFPSFTNYYNTNVTMTISVTAGSHTIVLTNAGLDWMVLGTITLNPYASMLSSYQVGNTNFAALWLWHQTNLLYPNATATVSGTVPLSGLAPGTYNGTWWDTFAGTAVSNFTFSVVDTNPVTLATPPILRSTAFFAGPAPQAGLSAPSLVLTLGSNSPAVTFPITLTNSGGLPLSYSLCVTGASPVSYSAMSSTQSGGPVYAWKDISGVGTDITSSFTAVAPPQTAADEGIVGPVNIGFGFPFFSGSQSPDIFNQLYVSQNGFVTFNPFAGSTSTNTVLPSASAPSNCIAFFWRDLDLSNGGKIYTATDAVNGTFTVQFQGVRFRYSTSTVTCQIILKTAGEILMQYQSLSVSNTSTVGVQDAGRTQGSTVVYNGNYLQGNFVVRLTPTRWFSLSANANLVPKASSETVYAVLNPAGLLYGTNKATLLIATGDASQPLFSLPVEIAVTPLATWRQSKFGTAANSGSAADTADPDGDGLANIVEYAFNLDPNVSSPNPISSAVTGGHLTLSFNRTHPAPADVTYWVEVTDDLTSGTWNSGPSYTTQTVTDNGNGTETVTITDVPVIGTTPAHFLRVRIGQ